jgi:hypothetical protein
MYASLATAAPSVGRARVTPSASSRSNLGAGRAMRGLGSESLHRSNGAAGVRLSRRRVATPCRAKTLEERIASGEFTKPRSSPAEDLLNGVRGLIRNVDNPQGECAAAGSRVHNEIRGLHGTPAPSAPQPDRVAPGRSRWTLRRHRRVASSANPPANRDGESHRAATRIPHP